MSRIPEDTYSDFAERYDLFHDSPAESNPDRVGFFKAVFADHNVKSILDCACGTGRDLLLFASLGLEVFGSDISESMLKVARRNLAEHGSVHRGADQDDPMQDGEDHPAGGRGPVRIPLERVDYRDLPEHYGRKFDAVACLSSSILEMPDEMQVLRAFRSMWGVLNDGGALILTQGTADKMWTEKPRFIPAVNRPDFSRLFVIDYTERGAHFNVIDLFHSEDRSDFRVWSKEYKRILLRDDHRRLLAEAGFSRIDFYGTYRLDPYDRVSSGLLICVATR